MRHRARFFALRLPQLIGSTLTSTTVAEHYRTSEVRQLTALPKSTIINWSQNGRFPKPAGLVKGTTIYSKAEVDAWCKTHQDLIQVRQQRLAQKTLRRSAVNDIVDANAMLNIEQVSALIGLSSGHIYREIRAGRFPVANLAGGGTKGNHSLWHKDVVDQYLKARPSLNKTNGFDFTADEMRQLRTAAKAVYSDLDFFIKEAALWKAKFVLRQLQQEELS